MLAASGTGKWRSPGGKCPHTSRQSLFRAQQNRACKPKTWMLAASCAQGVRPALSLAHISCDRFAAAHTARNAQDALVGPGAHTPALRQITTLHINKPTRSSLYSDSPFSCLRYQVVDDIRETANEIALLSYLTARSAIWMK